MHSYVELIRGALLCGVAGLALLGPALQLWRPLALGRLSLDLLLVGFLWHLLVMGLVLGTGLLGLLAPPVLAAVSAALLGLGLVSSRRPVATALSDLWHERPDLPRDERRALLWLILPFTLLALRLGLHVWFLPPYLFDVLTYHLPKVADWIQQGQLVMLPTSVTRSYWPAGFELLQAWWMCFWHHDAFVELAGITWYGLAIGAAAVLLRAMGASRPVSGWLALATGFAPGLLLSAASGKNDIAVAAIFLLGMAVLADHLRRPRQPLERLVWLVLLGLAGIGIKPYQAFLIPGWLVFMIGAFWQRSLEWRDLRLSGRTRGTGLLLIGLAAALGGYWYVRNAVWFHNPFYPAEFRLFGRLLSGPGEAGVQQGTFSLQTLRSALDALLHSRLWDGMDIFNPDLAKMAGWGWLAVGPGLPATVLAWRLSRPFRWLSAGFVVALLVLLGWVSPDPWNQRFTQWFPVLLTVGIGVVLAPGSLWKPVRHALVLLVAGATLLNAVAAWGTGYAKPADWKYMASLPVWERSTALLFGAADAHVLSVVPPGAVLAYDLHGGAMRYALYGADLSRKMRFVNAMQPGDLVARLRRDRAGYLYVPQQGDGRRERLARLVSERKLEPLRWGLYRVCETP